VSNGLLAIRGKCKKLTVDRITTSMSIIGFTDRIEKAERIISREQVLQALFSQCFQYNKQKCL
jgi:hypothetical protein